MKTRNRKRSRGAAMIEGVIVVSTMLVFMGFINYSRQSYGMKLDLQQQTRSNTLFFASHGCEGGGASKGAGGTVPGDNPAAGAAGKSGQDGAAAASRSYNTASASAQKTASFQATWDVNANGGDSSINLQKQTGSRQINAASKVTCNEKQYKNQWTAWAEFGMDFAMNLGGASSLFN
ncbi:MAG: hypothetical protein KIT84_30850 [Labilithrix sp.]|nr:hypothetical protein [Labilithrix sp.]MCW5815467.1 hypothetical protein [Labilithrix sp.]